LVFKFFESGDKHTFVIGVSVIYFEIQWYVSITADYGVNDKLFEIRSSIS